MEIVSRVFKASLNLEESSFRIHEERRRDTKGKEKEEEMKMKEEEEGRR